MITDVINNNLTALFNLEDPVYKALISDKDGTIPVTVTLPTDFDIGVIASEIEYLRQLSINMVNQLFLDKAQSMFLTYILNNFFASLRMTNESDVAWVNRVIASIFSTKLSHASIIFALRPFSSLEPIIENLVADSAFADFSYADIYTSGNYNGIFYYAAVAEDMASTYFSLKITLQDTLVNDIYTVQDIIDRIVAAGISVLIQINYTV